MRFLLLARIVTAVTLCAYLAQGQAQTVLDFEKQAGPNRDRLLVMIKSLDKPKETHGVVLDESFFDSQNLLRAFSGPPFLLVTLERQNTLVYSGKIRFATPIIYRSKSDFERAKQLDKGRIDKCVTGSNGQIACLREPPEKEKLVRSTLGRIRKVLLAKDFLILTMTSGNLYAYRIEGDYADPQPKLYPVNLPSPLSSEVLYQDLVQVHFGSRFKTVAAGLNGKFAGRPLGSKVWLFDGSSESSNAKARVAFARSMVPSFNGIFPSDGRAIQVQLAPYPWDLSFLGLDTR